MVISDIAVYDQLEVIIRPSSLMNKVPRNCKAEVVKVYKDRVVVRWMKELWVDYDNRFYGRRCPEQSRLSAQWFRLYKKAEGPW